MRLLLVYKFSYFKATRLIAEAIPDAVASYDYELMTALARDGLDLRHGYDSLNLDTNIRPTLITEISKPP